jgi:ubiquinone biosynthesis protein Coq4
MNYDTFSNIFPKINEIHRIWYIEIYDRNSDCNKEVLSLFSVNERKYFLNEINSEEYLMKKNYEIIENRYKESSYDVITIENIEENPKNIPDKFYCIWSILDDEFYTNSKYFEFLKNAEEYLSKINLDNKNNIYYVSGIDTIIIDEI